MIKNISKIEIQIENRIYQLLCDSDAPLGHVKEAIFQLSKYVGAVEDQIIKMQKEQQQKEEEKPVEV